MSKMTKVYDGLLTELYQFLDELEKTTFSTEPDLLKTLVKFKRRARNLCSRLDSWEGGCETVGTSEQVPTFRNTP